MATIYADAAGGILRVVRPFNTALGIEAPAEATQSLDMDEETNALLLDEVSKSPIAFTLQGGVLEHQGTPMLIVPDGENRQDRKGFDQQFDQFMAQMQAYLDTEATATNAQVKVQVKDLTRGVMKMAKIVKRLREEYLRPD